MVHVAASITACRIPTGLRVLATAWPVAVVALFGMSGRPTSLLTSPFGYNPLKYKENKMTLAVTYGVLSLGGILFSMTR